ncbi:MAG: ABC transporter ATP-binding protein [Cyclobacteriaceae bacterium]|nr:ABC transporter ATP-binding protein [Cyclobacteriaceae bacterium]
MIDALKKLFEILPSSDRWKMGVLFLLMMFGTLLEVAGIGMLPVFVSAVSDPSFVLDNEWLGPVAASLGIETSRDLLVYGGIALVAIFFVKTVYLIWFNYIKTKFVKNRFALISNNLFETYLTAPYTFHLNRNTSELIRNVTLETSYISGNIMMPFLTILMDSVMVIGIFLLLMAVEPVVTLVSFLIIGGGGGLLLKLIKGRLRYYGKSAKRERKRMIQGVTEGIGGYKDVTVMNRQKRFLQRFRGFVANMTRAEIFKSVSTYASRPVIELIAVAGMVFIAGLMLFQGREMGAIIPILALFGAAVVRLIPSVSHIITKITTLRYYAHSLDSVHRDLSSMKDHANTTRFENRRTEKLPFEQEITLNNVSYRYPGAEGEAVKNISLSIPKGSAVGFVGESGAGKSTIVDVILGLLEPQQGQVLVDGVDIRQQKRAWQNNVGYIPQFIYLADDTIRNNIAFGLSDEEIEEEKVAAAVEAAQLDALIRELPDGLDTVIGENGVRLSGGQRQRIGIARALYNNPAVLIMDEATSALDNITEKQVIRSIEALKGERTIIMIAHRLTTVQNCDIIYHMKKGGVFEEGAYELLMSKSEEFRRMNLAEF